MGSQWQLKGTTLTVSGLRKPYQEGDVPPRPRLLLGIKSLGDGCTVEVSLTPGNRAMAAELALEELEHAGYLDQAQKVTVTQVDPQMVLISFEHQTPLYCTQHNLRNLLSSVQLIIGERLMAVGGAKHDIDQAIGQLWEGLHKQGVVASSRPPKY